MRIKVNENLTEIIQFIRESDHIISWNELIQHCLDYNMYPELYLHRPIFEHLINEHDELIRSKKWKRPN